MLLALEQSEPMRASIPVLLEATYACWATGDLEAMLRCVSDDITFVNHLPTDVVPFAGPVRGKAALAQQLGVILDQFEIIEYRPVRITAVTGSFHSQVHFHYRHKSTGLTYEGSLRHVWQIEGDKIVRLEEFHDPERTRAFFELLASYEQRPDESRPKGDG